MGWSKLLKLYVGHMWIYISTMMCESCVVPWWKIMVKIFWKLSLKRTLFVINLFPHLKNTHYLIKSLFPIVDHLLFICTMKISYSFFTKDLHFFLYTWKKVDGRKETLQKTIRMSQWRCRATEGAEFWISCKRPVLSVILVAYN